MKKEGAAVLPFLLISVLALFFGLWAGLSRLGWAVPQLSPSIPGQHGPLMVSGFLGTLITLERVAALRKRWMYAAPLLSGSGAIISLALPGALAGPLLMTLGSLAAAGILGVMVRREPKLHTVTMAIGALSWVTGNVLWLAGAAIFEVVWLWAAFLVLTITGERLELSRVLRPKKYQFSLFAAAVTVYLLGSVIYAFAPQAGALLTGAGMLSLSAWLLLYDLARRNIRHPAALTRFIAVCLYSGFAWLGLSGVFILTWGVQYAGYSYDAMLHAVFVGFVFSMIFGHAPIILPALTGILLPFRRAFYLPLWLLHLSLALRIAGDIAAWAHVRRWGGLLNETAVLLFIGLLAGSVLRRRAK